MERYEPYYAQDTDGVHFQVNVDGVFVQAYVSRTILHIAYGSSEPRAQCLATYLEHREDIDLRIEPIAKAVGLTQGQVSKLMNGTVKAPRYDTVGRLADYFNLSVRVFYVSDAEAEQMLQAAAENSAVFDEVVQVHGLDLQGLSAEGRSTLLQMTRFVIQQEQERKNHQAQLEQQAEASKRERAAAKAKKKAKARVS